MPPLGINEDSLEALIELSRWNIPAIVSAGPILGTSSPITIAGTIVQDGFETALIGLVTALNADLMDSMQLDSDLLVDYADLFFCNECMGALKRVSRELVVDEDTMVLELIKEIGHGGTFLDHAHTFENFRAELWLPQIMEHRNWDNWETDGALDIRTVSLQKVVELLETKPEYLLSSSVEAEIDRVVKEAQQSCEAS